MAAIEVFEEAMYLRAMYSKIQLLKKYIQYYRKSANGRGHGIHSPFLFEFIIRVLNDKKSYPCYSDIEEMRTRLLKSKKNILIEDFGAGSRVIESNNRWVSDIAKSSLKPKKYSRLLFRMVQFYRPRTVLELGTCFGITTSYLASGHDFVQVNTMEGAMQIAQIAQSNFKQLSLSNIRLIQGNFDHILPKFINEFIESGKELDFVFIDGNHRKEPTLHYFEDLLPILNENSILVFDDIHWSEEMEEAWSCIKKHEAVTMSIDLFFVGIVFFRKDFKVKQDFIIRF